MLNGYFEFSFQKFLIGLLSRQGPSHKLWLTSKFFKSLKRYLGQDFKNKKYIIGAP